MVPGVQARDHSSIHITVTPLKIAAVVIVNCLIAIFIVSINSSASFLISLIFSQCIGLSIAACTIAAANLIRIRWHSLHIAFIAVALVGGAVLGIVIGSAVARFFFPELPRINTSEHFQTSLIFALFFGVIVTYIFFSFQRISTERVRRLEVEKNAVITEIKLLQSQMEPHFLFNTLSTIISFIDDEPAKAKKMLESFTSFLRTSLVLARSETITLSQEIDMVKHYLDVFSIRMGDRLRYTIDVPDELKTFSLPPLLIQPLVENAIKHGLEPSVRGGELRITSVRNADVLRMIVVDSGRGVSETSQGNGIGLENIRKRLELAYGRKSKLIFEENKPSGVCVTIEIPYETVAGDHR